MNISSIITALFILNTMISNTLHSAAMPAAPVAEPEPLPAALMQKYQVSPTRPTGIDPQKHLLLATYKESSDSPSPATQTPDTYLLVDYNLARKYFGVIREKTGGENRGKIVEIPYFSNIKAHTLIELMEWTEHFENQQTPMPNINLSMIKAAHYLDLLPEASRLPNRIDDAKKTFYKQAGEYLDSHPIEPSIPFFIYRNIYEADHVLGFLIYQKLPINNLFRDW
jgi:hypothetical protein